MELSVVMLQLHLLLSSHLQWMTPQGALVEKTGSGIDFDEMSDFCVGADGVTT